MITKKGTKREATLVRKGTRKTRRTKEEIVALREMRAKAKAQRLAEREAKRAEREAKRAEREEKLRVAKLPAIKLSSSAIAGIIDRLDTNGKFSKKKVTALTTRIRKISEAPPRIIANRVKARQFQADLMQAIFEEAVTVAKKLPNSKKSR